ncbi:MAG: DUF302 domain-containing protein [Armatimonadetes bacterium]|nr:DUF302 domain-containing protein [Armatimonadota bacterium]
MGNMEGLGFSVTLDEGFEKAEARTREALKAEGFGIISEIDIKAVLKEKIDADFHPYTILGACNPHLAKKALDAAPEVGLLLPCNVTVEQVDGGTRVTAIDPIVMLDVIGENPAIKEVAEDARPRLMRAIASLESND